MFWKEHASRAAEIRPQSASIALGNLRHAARL
jgi:hypothetical protein